MPSVKIKEYQKKKNEALNYAIKINSNFISTQKYGLSQWSLRYWRKQIQEFEKDSKKRENNIE